MLHSFLLRNYSLEKKNISSYIALGGEVVWAGGGGGGGGRHGREGEELIPLVDGKSFI